MKSASRQEEWTEIITPRRGLWDIPLRELWRYRDLTWLFVLRDIKAQYKQTILGPLWFLVQPLLSTLVFFFIFNRIARLPTDGIPPVLFYLSGIVLWSYFAECLNKTSNVFTVNANIFGKVYFPRLTIPISVVIGGLVRLATQLFTLAIIIIYYIYADEYRFQPNLALLLTPLLIVLLAALGLSLGIIFSSLTTKYKDLSFLLAFGVQLWMYASPVIYPLRAVTGKLRDILLLNPVTPVIETFRYALFGSGYYEPGALLYTALFSLVAFVIGIVIFNQVEKSFMDTV
ncbi:MAG: ABC transporter permease [Chitinophagales bacterium]|nr:ABC transporter permease [Chitinophagales bacterium]MDW8418234.1 ABC transporter permease [Chitinophagales bacterium]